MKLKERDTTHMFWYARNNLGQTNNVFQAHCNVCQK